MEIRFYIDPESGLAHCYSRHGITEREAIEVLRRPGALYRKGDTLVAEGQTNVGRYIRVIHRKIPEQRYIFVITAYDLKGNAKRAYRADHRRR